LPANGERARREVERVRRQRMSEICGFATEANLAECCGNIARAGAEGKHEIQVGRRVDRACIKRRRAPTTEDGLNSRAFQS